MFTPVKRLLVAIAAMGALALGASTIAGAATSSGTSNSSSSSTTSQAPPAFNGPPHGSAAHEDAEKAVSGTAATKAQAAAVKAAGGGSAGPVTSDFTQNGYEVTVTKSDGSKVEIHLDSSYNAMAPGGPGGPSGSGRPG